MVLPWGRRGHTMRLGGSWACCSLTDSVRQAVGRGGDGLVGGGGGCGEESSVAERMG